MFIMFKNYKQKKRVQKDPNKNLIIHNLIINLVYKNYKLKTINIQRIS